MSKSSIRSANNNPMIDRPLVGYRTLSKQVVSTLIRSKAELKYVAVQQSLWNRKAYLYESESGNSGSICALGTHGSQVTGCKKWRPFRKCNWEQYPRRGIALCSRDTHVRLVVIATLIPRTRSVFIMAEDKWEQL
jgi:hypothetical protein